ncbi:MAG: 50S ribosomal protein L23 [Deltaproteobacteria bacterium]|nr:50S ribosomal protein L23 [Deltaproteobacteria bacterium]
MNLSQIIKRPLVTEKSSAQKELMNRYSFEVDPKSNKYQICEALESLFKVDVLDIHTLNVRGKTRRVGRNFGRRSNWKKAIVTLKQGQKIEFFEGVS